MDSEQRRKRKRVYRPYSRAQYLSVRSLILCCSFLVFLLCLSSDRLPIRAVSFKPVLSVPTISLLPSNSVQDSFNRRFKLFPLAVDERVLFPDHLLLMVSKKIAPTQTLDCIYYKSLNSSEEATVKIKPLLSIDEYDEFRWVARCPLPPVNYSAIVDLKRQEVVAGRGWSLRRNETVHSWKKMAYAAVLDGKTVLVFVKGLNLRPHKESDHTLLRCQFALGSGGKNEGFVLMTDAVAAAQEVVRCLLPRSIRQNPSRAQGIRVTVVRVNSNGRALGVGDRRSMVSVARIRSSRLYGQRRHQRIYKDYVPIPSVAKIYNSNYYQLKKNKRKYELCVCTMLWNQASSIREWIMYHSWLGVERWFIYDNNSDDGIQDVVKELNLQNYNVSRHNWPWIKTQEAGFSHCALRARNECKWVGFFDVDEFFYFPRDHRRGLPGQNSLQSLVANVSSSKTVAEIRTSCHSFGPSGLSSHPVEGVTVGYSCRLQSPERHKSIVRPDLLNANLLNVVHHFRLQAGYRYMNMPENIAVINHYKYQVWETFRAKFYRRVATYVVDWQENQNTGSKDRAPGLGTKAIEPPNWRLQFCEVWDTGLRDFVLANFADPATGSLPWE
ncbi:glycosyltransferase family 92 protein RCOM_0530710-like [Mangifera indica]|uniref:glycosyltransferase family 92 protein RCOM_0530710-like n=1 Tax=Mangifera indica TaxID=29780 RepID=UPI001CFB852A|nr:glycosyltransferase family 92 protein RCOM_0530710-like [Mangifera indica]